MNHVEVWHKISDYYYDNVHWEITDKTLRGLYNWLQREYGVKFNPDILEFEFLDDKKKSWFILRWS